MKFFYPNIKFLRDSNKMTQGQFADYLGITRGNISNWEREHGLPSVEVLFKMSVKFSISIDDLLSIDLSVSKNDNQKSTDLSNSNNLLMEDPASYGKDQVIIPGVNWKAITVKIEGDSMSPTLMHGDYVVGEEVSDVRLVRQNSLCIVCMSDRMEVKYVTRYEAGLRLVSESEKYNSELVEWGGIESVWEVKVRITESFGVVGHPDYDRLCGEVEELVRLVKELETKKGDRDDKV